MVSFIYRYKKPRVRVAGLIEDELGRILLVKQKKKKKDYWLLPGGGIEYGESATVALEREILEELNVKITQPEFLLLNESIDPKGGRHLIQLVFSAKIIENLPVISKKEKNTILEIRYFTMDELANIEVRPNLTSYLKSNNRSTKSIYIKSEWIQE